MEWKQGKFLETKTNNMDKMIDMPELIYESFRFLEEEYDFVLIKKVSDNSGLLYIYQNQCMKIAISLDYRDGYFFIDVIEGKNARYPNDAEYGKKIKSLSQLLIKLDDKYDVSKLSVVNREDIHKVLKENENVLRKYGNRILSCNESI